jgi:hypothetical protein
MIFDMDSRYGKIGNARLIQALPAISTICAHYGWKTSNIVNLNIAAIIVAECFEQDRRVVADVSYFCRN